MKKYTWPVFRPDGCRGLSLRQCQRIAAGEQRVPPTVERLLRVLVNNNLNVEEVN